ncbi:hypothetical protein WJX77_012139 [Trebouxia sp. C0004]
MEQWLDLDADPLLDPTPPPPQHRGPALSRTSPEGAAFFKLQPCQDSINVPKQQALLAEGLLWLTKLTDPEYTAAEEARPNLAGTHGDSSSKSRGLQGRQHMLTKAGGSSKVEEHLAGDKPGTVQFPNHKSVDNYRPFVQSEAVTGVDKGVIAKWSCQQPPTVVLPATTHSGPWSQGG